MSRYLEAEDRLRGAGAVVHRRTGIAHSFYDGRLFCARGGNALELNGYTTLGAALASSVHIRLCRRCAVLFSRDDWSALAEEIEAAEPNRDRRRAIIVLAHSSYSRPKALVKPAKRKARGA